MSFSHVANTFDINFRYVFTKDIGLQFLINLLCLSFLLVNVIITCVWDVLNSSLIKASLIDASNGILTSS